MEEADIVVVGGGSGGAAVAGRLSEGGRFKVALLEAGGRNTGLKTIMPGMMPFQTTKTNYQYGTVPQAGLNGRRGYVPRGRGLGGSSAINAMVYVRGNAWDYDNWAAMGCTGWSHDEVLPYFKKSEHNVRGGDAWHGGDGPLWVSDQRHPHPGSEAFVEAATRLQIARNDDFNGASQDGAGLYQVTQKDGERWTSSRAYLGGTRPNLVTLTEVAADRVLFDDGRACGVAYTQGGQAKTIRANGAVVLAGGVFGTPQLLMLSGIGEPRHLAEHGVAPKVDRPAVGTNLQDHLDYTASFETTLGNFLGRSLKGNIAGLTGILRWLRTRDGPMTTCFAEAGAFLKTRPDVPAPDIQLHFVIGMVEDHGRARIPGHGYSCHVCVLRPESSGTVRLASPDPRAMPLIDPAFLSDPRDLAVMKRGVHMMYRILETPPLADYQGKDRYPFADDQALERLIRARSDTIYHPVGTARMGSDADAVVDPHLRVRGVDGLYVSDASIMPKLISGNTNAPSMMIGERCAEFVAEGLA